MNSSELNALLEAYRDRHASEERLREIEEAQVAEEIRRAERFKERALMPRLHKASADDYIAWLGGHLAEGGCPTHVYDYKFPAGRFFVSLEDLSFDEPLFGAQAVDIIVPAGLTVTGRVGHCQLYLMAGFRNVGGIVPLYEDISF